MSYFTESITQREEGARLLDESSNLYKKASESENISEILELTLEALNKDLEALSIIWEATISQKAAVEELRESCQKGLKELDAEILNVRF